MSDSQKDEEMLLPWLSKEQVERCDEWKKLTAENEELKRILKNAMSDIYKECSCNTCGCDICEYNRETCDYDDRFTWRYKAAVLKLIGETNDEP